MSRLGYFVQKELLLLGRDLHGLLLLFAMPMLFILIMSFALQNQFNNDSDVIIDYYLVNHDAGKTSAALVDNLALIPTFNRLREQADNELDEKTIEVDSRAQVAKDRAKSLVVVDKDFDQKLSPLETFILNHFILRIQNK